MKIIKLLFLGVFGGVLVIVGIYVAINRGFIKIPLSPDLIAKLPTTIQPYFDVAKFEPAFQSATQQATILSDRLNEVSQHTSNVLGSSVQVNEAAEKESLQNKAFEYARYQYCQQVIKEYDSKTTTSPD